MDKTATCIKIIQILSCRDLVNTKELAEIVDTNPRNIREYIQELETAGYTIESVKGKNGGYRLSKGDLLPSVRLSDDDKKILRHLTDYLTDNEDFQDNVKALDILGRVLSTSNKNVITPSSMSERFRLNMEADQLQNLYSKLDDCINSQLKCEILYLTASNQIHSYIVDPYKIFNLGGTFFAIVWNETIEKYSHIKLNRIQNLTITNKRFTIMKDYKEEDFLDEYGMKKHGEYYHVEFEFTNVNVAIKERRYGKNQKIIELDDNHLIMECDMQNKEIIKSFVLSYGKNCKVLSPEWLIEEIQNEILKIFDNYEEDKDVKND